jgi:rRNA maturation RNase YbeY
MKEYIYFFSQEIDFEITDENFVKEWLAYLIKQNKHAIQELNFVFVSDAYLLEMNNKHLAHDYYTDILTFSYEDNPIHADIYISIDRVKDNAQQLQIPFVDELHRVMAHGVLHILGYDDHEDSDIKLMRKQEEMALALRNFISR